MSFLQGLRAGTSSSTSSTSYRPIYVKKSYDVIIRHATTASPEKQAYEAAIKKQQQVAKQQQRAAGRLGDNASHMMDITEMPLLVGKAEKPFSWKWLLAWRSTPEQIEWRRTRWFDRRKPVTSQESWAALRIAMVGLLIQRRAIEPPGGIDGRFIRRPETRARMFLDDATDIYRRYNEAQAEKNVAVIRQTSKGEALKSAERVAKSGQAMTWQLANRGVTSSFLDRMRNRWNGVDQRPRIAWIKLDAIDPSNFDKLLAQVCLQFDTIQVLTYTAKGKKPIRKVQRVVEAYVLEKRLPGEQEWRLKQRVELQDPFFVKEWKEGKAISVRQAYTPSSLQAMSNAVGSSLRRVVSPMTSVWRKLRPKIGKEESQNLLK